jgi:hypothetical protein
LQEATDKLRRENERLTEQLRKAEIVIDVQKKWPRCWDGRSRPPTRSRSLDGCRQSTRPHRRRRVGLRRSRRCACFLLPAAATARTDARCSTFAAASSSDSRSSAERRRNARPFVTC